MKTKKGFELQNVCGEHILVPAGIENVDFSRIISLSSSVPLSSRPSLSSL